MRIELAKFQRRQLVVEKFRDVAGNNLEVQVQLPQQFRPPGRRGSQNQRRQIHAKNLNFSGQGCRAAVTADNPDYGRARHSVRAAFCICGGQRTARPT